MFTTNQYFTPLDSFYDPYITRQRYFEREEARRRAALERRWFEQQEQLNLERKLQQARRKEEEEKLRQNFGMKSDGKSQIESEKRGEHTRRVLKPMSKVRNETPKHHDSSFQMKGSQIPIQTRRSPQDATMTDLPQQNSHVVDSNVVVVEDASDSESENDITTSVWRRRRPSPGEWMEPIGCFTENTSSPIKL